MRFPWGFDEEDDRCQKLKMELAQQIMVLHQCGVTQFLTACDCGVGLYAAEIVNGLRETTDQDLMLFCYTPHEEQATKWAPYLRERYFTMLEKCTHISVVCPVGTPDAQLQAYRKILGLADVVLQHYIVPELGTLLLRDLTAEKLSAFFSRLQDRGLSCKSTRDVGVLLKTIFKVAKKSCHCDCPGREAELPAYRSKKIEVFCDHEIT